MSEIITTLITIGIVMGATLGGCLYLVLAERKISAWMQDRMGPNRVGPFGLGQPIADAIKVLLKESIIPSHVDKTLFLIAPTISVLTTLLAFSVVPFGPVGEGPTWFRFIIAPDINIGIVFILAVTSLAVYGIILGGWASNSKYSALGSLRASAQVVSYEIPLGLSLIGIVLLSGTLNLETILSKQASTGIWYIWYQPLACLIFFTSALAESNRLPFDLPECEQELVGGYHTEYGGLRMVLFFVGEYTHVVTVSFLTAIVFLGGWHFPWIATSESVYAGAWIVKLGVLLAKVAVLIVFIMLIRWTIPRFRFDQLMALAWIVLIPLSLLNIVAVMFVKQFNVSEWWLPVASLALFALAGIMSVNSKRAELRHRPRANLASA